MKVFKPTNIMPCGKLPCNSSCSAEKCSNNLNCPHKMAIKALSTNGTKLTPIE
jgi:hypothetical protein